MFTKLLDFLLQPFIAKQPENALNTAILDTKYDYGSMYPKLALFYHYTLYSKAVDILKTVYGGYNGNYSTYIPPSGSLYDLYVDIRYAFERIDTRSDFSGLDIVDFTAFADLYANHFEQIELWEGIRESFSEDAKRLKKRVVQTYTLANDVRVTFFDIDKEIEEHKKKRNLTTVIEENDLLSCGKLILNFKNGNLTYSNNKPVKVTPSNQEIKLLVMLIKNVDRVVEYESLAKDIDINSYNGEVTDEVKTALKTIKNKLNDLLKSAGLKNKPINSIRANGYILNSMKLK